MYFDPPADNAGTCDWLAWRLTWNPLDHDRGDHLKRGLNTYTGTYLKRKAMFLFSFSVKKKNVFLQNHFWGHRRVAPRGRPGNLRTRHALQHLRLRMSLLFSYKMAVFRVLNTSSRQTVTGRARSHPCDLGAVRSRVPVRTSTFARYMPAESASSAHPSEHVSFWPCLVRCAALRCAAPLVIAPCLLPPRVRLASITSRRSRARPPP